MVGVKKVTIAQDAALSDAADLKLSRLVGITLPAAWTAADVTFQVSANGNDFVDLFNLAGEYKIPTAQAAANRQYILDIHDTPGIRYIKIRSGVAGAPVNQAAERVITLLVDNPGLI